MSAPTGEIGEPPLEECLDLVDQMAAAGVREISLTGGEALVRKDFLQIVDRILERGMFITTIMSNGLLVTDKLLDELESRGMHPEFNMSFAEVLSDSSYMDFMALRLADYFRKNPGCSNCEFHNRCAGGCRGQAVEHSDTADVLAKDPEVCTFFKKGWYQKTLTLIEELEKAKAEKAVRE